MDPSGLRHYRMESRDECYEVTLGDECVSEVYLLRGYIRHAVLLADVQACAPRALRMPI